MSLQRSNPPIQSTMGGPSHEVMALAAAYGSSTNAKFGVLDLGCGDGRNAFLLANLRTRVTAVDISTTFIEQLRSLAKRHNRPIDAIVSDVVHFQFEAGYDAVLALGILHFLKREDIDSLVKRIKTYTLPGGYNMYTVSTFASHDAVIEDFKSSGHQNVLKKGELLQYYADWEVVAHESYTKWDYHPSVGPHSHPIEKIVLRRPSKGRPLLLSRKIDLTKDDREERVAGSLRTQTLIGLTKDKIIALCGSPRQIVRYAARGAQFAFREFCENGYLLQLLFYGRYMIYLANDVVSGVSFFDSPFFELKPSATAEQRHRATTRVPTARSRIFFDPSDLEDT